MKARLEDAVIFLKDQGTWTGFTEDNWEGEWI